MSGVRVSQPAPPTEVSTKALILTLLLTGPALASPVVEPVFQKVKNSAVEIGEGKGPICGGFIFSKSRNATVIGTATHCIEDPETTKALVGMTINDIPVNYREVARDGFDHSFIRVDKNIEGQEAKLGYHPRQGEDIFLWGQPQQISHSFRKGYYIGTWTPDPLAGMGLDTFDTYDIEIFKGDSGSAIFNMKGKVVGIVTGRDSWFYFVHDAKTNKDWPVMTASFSLTYPLQFTPLQLKAATLQPWE